MSFIWPTMLLLLLLIPLCVGLYVMLQQRRRRLAASYGALGLVQEATGRPLGWRRHIPPALFLAGLVLLMFALARPQAVVNLPRIEGTIILAFDVSGSMAADDLKPTRMEAAKAAAWDFVQRQPSSVQIGVVAFSDGGFAVQAPTNDQEAILATINRLTPQRGTSLGQGILASLNTIAAGAEQAPPLDSNLTPTPPATPTPVPYGTYTPAVIVLLTDGENNERQRGGNNPARQWLHRSHSARRGDAATNLEAHRGRLLQRPEPTRPTRDLRKPGPAVGDQIGKDGSYLYFCGCQYPRLPDRRYIFAPMVQPLAVSLLANG
jgi:hypothetical protein